MIKIWILIFSLFLIGFISASCNETQVDINSASAIELDKITGVGSAIAQRIIDNRTYNSVDDLLRVKGIGEATLEKIKAQGVACVSGEETEEPEEEIKEEEDNENVSTTSNKTSTNVKGSSTRVIDYSQPEETNEEIKELPLIHLNSQVSKDIKSDDNKGNLTKNLPLYGTIAFAVVFGAFFLLSQRKKKHGFE